MSNTLEQIIQDEANKDYVKSTQITYLTGIARAKAIMARNDEAKKQQQAKEQSGIREMEGY